MKHISSRIIQLMLGLALGTITVLAAPSDSDPALQENTHVVAVNQVGYISDQAKRFSAPLSSDGSQFIVRSKGGAAPLFEGTIRGHIGEFTSFRGKWQGSF